MLVRAMVAAVGGSLMFLSHLVFAYNLWTMRPARVPAPVQAPVAAARALS